MFGMYAREHVMVVGVPEDIADLDGTCLIEYYSPLSLPPVGTQRRVRWGDVTDLNGPAVGHQA